MLWYEHDGEFNEPSFVEAAIPLATAIAVEGVHAEDVGVAGFEEMEDAGFIDCTGTTVVCEGGEEDDF